MVHQVVINVLSDQTGRTITIEQAAPEKPQAEKEPKGKKNAQTACQEGKDCRSTGINNRSRKAGMPDL